MTGTLITGALITMALAFAGCLGKHLINSQKHPCKKDIVFKEVCQSDMKGLEDCVESEIKNLNNRITELKQDVKDGFAGLQNLIKNGG
jgi:hypothetical protein